MTLLEWPRRVAALAQVHVVDPSSPLVAKEVEHHLRKVLRANEGEEVVLCDGAGAWAFATVKGTGLALASDVHRDPAPPATSIYLAPLKGERSEWALAKAAEVGVARVVPLVSERTQVSLKGERGQKLLARWRRVAREASGQCRRSYDLAVGEPCAVPDVPEGVAVADVNGDGDWRGVSAVAVGPEGGWLEGEWSLSRRRLGLGPTVLRAETAGVIAAALVAFSAGDWGFTLGEPRNE